MIELNVSEYCENCEFFEPVAETTVFNTNFVQTVVVCEHSLKCHRAVANFLRGYKKGEEE